MTTPRCAQISLDDTPYYHCIARCVRRAFLCGDDNYSGRNFDHRRQWLIKRIKLLSDIFAIDICAYTIMHNHYHIVLRVDRDRALAWSEEEVILRWTELFKGPILIQNYLTGASQSIAARETVKDIVHVWRKRLYDIGWFMRCLNEYIARQANAEDDCKGHFWESRYKLQALLDTTALLSCMAYVDLNPIRAGTASTIEDSSFTSIQERLKTATSTNKATDSAPASQLLPFSESQHLGRSVRTLPLNLQDYIELVDWTGRIARQNKCGKIPSTAPTALQKLHLGQEQWLGLALDIQKRSLRAIGNMQLLLRYNQSCEKSWCSGQTALQKLYSSGSVLSE